MAGSKAITTDIIVYLVDHWMTNTLTIRGNKYQPIMSTPVGIIVGAYIQ